MPESLEAGPILEVDGLRIERARPGGSDTIVTSADLTLAHGETIGIVGPKAPKPSRFDLVPRSLTLRKWIFR